MDSARWERMQALFHRAAEMPPTSWRPWLESGCDDDPALVDDVLAMLAEDARGDTLLDRDVALLAHQVLGGTEKGRLPAARFGSYRITAMLGEGGMGVVYLGERDDLGQRAAIKILRDAWLSPARRERFASEQRALAQLNHPAIARIYDAGALEDGTPWFVMEYVEGVSLTQYCEAEAASVAGRLRLFRDVCEAVQHAHTHLIVHRDLKPSNILVRQDGSVKLLDFGISKQLDPRTGKDEHTRTAMRLMTPAYAAPEQIRGDRVGLHTDVYSLGVVLYELLAGRLPFDLSNRTPGEAESIVLEREPERPSAAARRDSGGDAAKGSRVLSASRRAWADLDVLCLTAMHKDPLRRYRTVEALIRDVDHFLGGEPLEARGDSLRYRAGKFLGRNWRPVAAAAAVVAAIVALVAFYTVRLAGARNDAVAEAARTQRIQGFMLNLFQGGDELAGPADSLRVITLVDRGLREARSLESEPVVRAELYHTLGGIYQQLGNLARADSLLTQALGERRRLLGADHPDAAASLVALGMLRADQARLEDAERMVREGLGIARASLPDDHPDVARALASLGQVLEARGRFDEAIPVLEDAVRRYTGPGAPTSELAVAMSQLANVHFYAGHYDASDSINHRLLEINRRLHGERHPHVADDLINLGAVQFERGNLAAAESLYKEGVDIMQSWYGPDHHRTAASLTMLARAQLAQRRPDDAVPHLERALATLERVYGPVHPRVASLVNELGTVALQRQQLDDAERYFTRMRDIYREVYADKHYYISIALGNLASVASARRDYRGAERLMREALSRYETTLAPDHLNVGIAHLKLGRALTRQARYADAESELLTGYEIVARQTNPSAAWLNYAREDLIAVYDAMRQAGKAARYRAELAGPDKPK